MVTNLMYQMKAFIKKEFLFLVRYPLQILYGIILPMVAILPSIFLSLALTKMNGMESFVAYSGTEHYLAYIFIGIIFFNFNDVQEQTGYLLQNEMWMGTLEQIWFSPAPKLFVLLGWICFAALKALCYATIGLLTVRVFGFDLGIHLSTVHLFSLFWGLSGLIISAVGFGILIASIILTIKRADAFVYLVTGLIPILCGISYPIHVLPGFVQMVSKVIPLTYAYDLIRYSFIQTKTIYSLQVEYWLVGIMSVLILLVSVLMFNALRRRVEIWGTIWLK